MLRQGEHLQSNMLKPFYTWMQPDTEILQKPTCILLGLEGKKGLEGFHKGNLKQSAFI